MRILVLKEFYFSKIYFKSLFLILFLITSNSQSQEIRSTSFILKGGINRTEIVGVDQNGEETGLVGIQIFGGILLETKIRNNLFIEEGLIFSYTDDYHYLEIPVELKIKMEENLLIKFGPKLDFILDNIEENSTFYYFKPFGVSANIGLEYNLNKSFLVDLNYSKGFVEQVNYKILDINNGKRNVIRLGLGFKF